MTVRAKMQCVSIDEYGTVKFSCIYDPENSPEDNSFSMYTPFGEATYGITNPEALKQFTVGQFYYFDMTPVPAAVETV